jgi:hypothetical protein
MAALSADIATAVWQVLGRHLSGIASKLFLKGEIHARREMSDDF